MYKKELDRKIDDYDPRADVSSKTHDPYNTLFIARLNYDTTEQTLRKMLEIYGKILNIKIIRDDQGESRGYAFAEFDSEGSLKAAYKGLDRKEIDGWKVLVDVERARTVENWLPKRLGGGLGIKRGRTPPKRGAGQISRSRKTGPKPDSQFRDSRSRKDSYKTFSYRYYDAPHNKYRRPLIDYDCP